RCALRCLGSPGVDAVLGAAADGGWWALGLRVPDPGAVRGVPMSTARTGSAQRERLHRLGLRIRELPVLRGVDTCGAALAVAPTAPGGAFARELRGILEAGLPATVLRCDDGHVVRLPVQRWTGEPSAEERLVLTWVDPPVLDIGCGPGRHVASLLRRGVPALGIDPAPSAVSLARSRGAAVLQRSVFDPLPRSGGWGTALLLDGNVGIGGDPARLLRRVGSLIRP